MKEINIGIAGCGGAGRGHLENYLHAGGKRAWVWDVRGEAAQSLASTAEVKPLSTFEELIGHPEIDAVVIATPNRFHAEMAVQAIEAGKHVLLEKPMALNAEDAEAILAAAERCERILHIGFELRQSTFPVLVKQFIDSGEIGTLISAHVTHYRGPFWPHWKGRRSDGGSMYLMEDCHSIDLFRWWSGDEVKTVHAVGTRRNVVRHYEYPDTQFSTFVFHNGFVGHITDCHARSAMPEKAESKNDYINPQFGHQYEYSIVGENGSLHYLPLKGMCRIYRHEPQEDGKVMQRLSRTVEFPSFSEAIHNGKAQMARFLEVMRGNRPPLIDPRDALQTHLVCFAAAEALESEFPVSPKIVYGNGEAATLRQRSCIASSFAGS